MKATERKRRSSVHTEREREGKYGGEYENYACVW